jgi:hypothetical protein
MNYFLVVLVFGVPLGLIWYLGRGSPAVAEKPTPQWERWLL